MVALVGAPRAKLAEPVAVYISVAQQSPAAVTTMHAGGTARVVQLRVSHRGNRGGRDQSAGYEPSTIYLVFRKAAFAVGAEKVFALQPLFTEQPSARGLAMISTPWTA